MSGNGIFSVNKHVSEAKMRIKSTLDIIDQQAFYCGPDELPLEQANPSNLTAFMSRQTMDVVLNAEIPPIPKVSRAERTRLIHTLDTYHFIPKTLSDEQVLVCTIILFEALWRIDGMSEAMRQFGIKFESIPPLLAHLQALYRYHSHHSSHSHTQTLQNPYHNFCHALDVLQSSYIYLKAEGLLPGVCILLDDDSSKWKKPCPSKTGPVGSLELIDVFIVLLVAVGHDVGHPGVANGFLKNTKTPLALLHAASSPLEAMHTTILLQTLKVHGMSNLLDREHTISSSSSPFSKSTNVPVSSYTCKLITRMIMSTDMCVHDSWVDNWKRVFCSPSPFISLSSPTPVKKLSRCNEEMEEMPVRDEDDTNPLWVQRVLVCQALIKCADISNPTRPYEITLAWSSSLLHEWISQAQLESFLNLPMTVIGEANALSEAKSQVGFAKRFALPLFELLAETQGVFSHMLQFVNSARENVASWQDRLGALESGLLVDVERDRELANLQPRHPQEYLRVFKPCLPPKLEERFPNLSAYPAPELDWGAQSDSATSVSTRSTTSRSTRTSVSDSTRTSTSTSLFAMSSDLGDTDTGISTPTSPSPVSDSPPTFSQPFSNRCDVTPPSSPTSSDSNASSLFSTSATPNASLLRSLSGRRKIAPSATSSNATSTSSSMDPVPPISKNGCAVMNKIPLRIGTSAPLNDNSNQASGNGPRSRSKGRLYRKASVPSGWKNWGETAKPSFSTNSSPRGSSSNSSTPATGTPLLSPFTPLTSPPPPSPPSTSETTPPAKSHGISMFGSIGLGFGFGSIGRSTFRKPKTISKSASASSLKMHPSSSMSSLKTLSPPAPPVPIIPTFPSTTAVTKTSQVSPVKLSPLTLSTTQPTYASICKKASHVSLSRVAAAVNENTSSGGPPPVPPVPSMASSSPPPPSSSKKHAQTIVVSNPSPNMMRRGRQIVSAPRS